MLLQYVHYLQRNYSLGSFNLLGHTAPAQAASLLVLGPFLDYQLTGKRVYAYDYSLTSIVSFFSFSFSQNYINFGWHDEVYFSNIQPWHMGNFPTSHISFYDLILLPMPLYACEHQYIFMLSCKCFYPYLCLYLDLMLNMFLIWVLWLVA